MPQSVWEQSLSRLKGRLSPTELGCWVQAIHPVEIRDRRFYGEVPSEMHLEQIRHRLQREIAAVLQELLGSGAELVLSVNRLRRQPVAEQRPVTGGSTSRYSFETFVVGESNSLAHASAREVVDHPGVVYNPLFLYGRVGLGKTHLASAVAHSIGKGARLRVALLSAEAFANDLIRALLSGAIDAFRVRVRQLDALIVDDIQFLAGKERMQEEFFHTFNALHATGKQIVLVSDQPPRSISNLEERLQSRFESGVTAEIRAPDAPLRLAILASKAKGLGLDLPLEVAQWVASKVVSSVRELEGALHRLVAAWRCSRRSLDIAFAKEVLRPILRTPPARTVEQVQRLVAERFQLKPEDLVRRGRTSRVRLPRQVAMYLARRGTKATYAEIAAGFGGRDHSTIMHAVKCVEARRHEEPEFATLVDQLAEKLGTG
ncbi:MAG TPA: chromosomal replication initiator protein DnaA [Candidatus Binatia bacterium]|nr:chromosomal replication initiator protein DnaA [Candidatus Binatia bacterium]